MTESLATSATQPVGRLAATARGGAANLVGAVSSAAANLGLVLVVARAYSPRDAGVFFTVTSLFLVFETVGRLGADTGLVYFIARWRVLGDNERIRLGIRAALGVVATVCVLVAAAMIAGAPWLDHFVGDPTGGSIALIRVLAVILPIAAVYDLTLAATRGLLWMKPTVLIEKIARPLLQIVLVAGVLRFGWDGALGVAWGVPYVVAAGASAVLLSFALRTRLRRGAMEEVAATPSVAAEFWPFALPRALASIAQIVLQRLDIVLVAILRGPRDAAIYTAATRFLVVGQMLNQAISAPVQPRLSAALVAGNLPRARELFRVSTTWLVLVSWPLFSLAAVLAPTYVAIFGRSYRDGAIVVVLLALSMLVASGVGLVDTVIIMAGRSAWNLATTLLALGVNVGLDVLLIPRFGILGAAVGWCGAILASNVVPLVYSARYLDLHPFGRSTSVAYVLCSVSFLVVPFLGWSVAGQRGAVVGAVLGACLYGVGLRRWWQLFELSGFVHRRRASAST